MHVDVDENKTNYELMNGQIYAEEWIHFMVTSDGYYTEVYINGENVFASSENNEIYITDALFSWEVGVGRKLGTDKATMNPKHPEGLIRRLFCGSMSEIRFTMNYMDIEDSLLYGETALEDNKQTEAPTDEVTEAPTEAPTDAPVTEAPTVPAETEAPVESATSDGTQAPEEGGCGAVMGGAGLLAALALSALLVYKRKE